MTLSVQRQTSSPEIRALTLPDLERLRLRRHFRLDADEVRKILETNPDLSFWIPDTDELILVGNWRNRNDLYSVHGLAATNNESALIAHAVERVNETHAAALLMVDADELRRPAFYVRNGFTIVDRIATYELSAGRQNATATQRDDITFSRVLPNDIVGRRDVVALDQLAFPWFWWNVDAEFDSYMALPGVEVWIGIHDEHVVSYIGITNYRGWGHLDRIATHPDVQRAGIGAATLEMAIRLLRVHGAKRIALSTQGENLPAQRMYERRGFVRTPVHDYTVHGYILDETRVAPIHETTRDQESAPGGRIRREREQ